MSYIAPVMKAPSDCYIKSRSCAPFIKLLGQKCLTGKKKHIIAKTKQLSVRNPSEKNSLSIKVEVHWIQALTYWTSFKDLRLLYDNPCNLKFLRQGPHSRTLYCHRKSITKALRNGVTELSQTVFLETELLGSTFPVCRSVIFWSCSLAECWSSRLSPWWASSCQICWH